MIRWLWQGYFRRYRMHIALAIVLMAVEGSMLGALSWSVRPMFDRVLVGGDRTGVALVAAVISGVFILRALTSFGQRVLNTWIGTQIAAKLQGDLMRHMIGLDSDYFTQNPPGRLIERVRGDTAAITSLHSGVIAPLIRDGVALVSLLGVALAIDWRWTLIAVAAAPLVTLPAARLQIRVRSSAGAARRAAARVTTRLDEVFHGVNAVKLAGTEEREARRFVDEQGPFRRAQVRTEASTAGITSLIDIVAAVGFFGVLSYGGFQIIDGEKTVGDFMAFFTAMALVFEPVRRLGNVSGNWAAATASLQRVHAVFALKPTILSPANPRPLAVAAAEADVVFDDVRFEYPGRPVLNGLSFTARAGRTTALVGPSGAGKSTVFGLLARLIERQSGSITIGGVGVEEMDLVELRGLFSVVAQDTLLFDETLRDNILMGAEAGEEALAAAADAAHVSDFASRLPEGLDSRAGPRGSALSGGQRQRVAIARALLRDRPILLLDEATSALDAASEAAVQDALHRLSEGRTTLVIAHRLSTIRAADRIVVMDHGRVTEEGTHDELLALDGLYAALCKMQFADS